jgi:hypothetical protein
MVDGPTLTAESFADWLLVYGHDPEQDARLQAKAVLVDDHAALLARAEAAEKALRVAQHGLSVVRQHVNWHEVNEAVAAVDAALGSSPAAEAETPLHLLAEGIADGTLDSVEKIGRVIAAMLAPRPPEHVFEAFRRLHGIGAGGVSDSSEADPKRILTDPMCSVRPYGEAEIVLRFTVLGSKLGSVEVVIDTGTAIGLLEEISDAVDALDEIALSARLGSSDTSKTPGRVAPTKEETGT